MATYGMIIISTDSFIPSLMHLIAVNIKVLCIEYGNILKTGKSNIRFWLEGNVTESYLYKTAIKHKLEFESRQGKQNVSATFS